MAKKPLPQLPEKAPGVNRFKYKPQYGVIVICDNEDQHKHIFERLSCSGYKCKAVRV